MKGYKGFDKDWKCNGFQFEFGKTYEHNSEVKLCNSGFHFCENPLDIFRYYPPTGKFAEIDAENVSDKKDTDSKRVCSKITVTAELSLKSFLENGFKFIFEKIKWGNADTPQTHGNSSAAQTHGNSSAAQTHGYYSAAQTHGYSSAAQTHGDYSAAQTHGYSSAAQTHGYSSAAQTHGKNSISVSTGRNGKSAGIIGSWLVLAEWGKDYNLLCVKSVKVDGKKIKENVFYILKCGKFVKAN